MRLTRVISQKVYGYGTMIKGNLEEIFDATTDEYAEIQKCQNIDKTLTYIFPLINRLAAKSVLDVGCGVGTMVKTLNGKGIDAYGVDLISLGRYWLAQDMDRERFFFVDPYRMELPFESNSLDFVFTLGAIEHVGTTNGHSERRLDYHTIRRLWIRELFRVIKPGGHLLIGGPNRCFPFDTAHGPDTKASPLELRLSRLFGLTVHKTWGENFLWSFTDVKRYLYGLPYSMKPQRISGYVYFSRVPKVLRGFTRLYIDYMPEFLLGTGCNPWMMALIRKKD